MAHILNGVNVSVCGCWSLCVSPVVNPAFAQCQLGQTPAPHVTLLWE